MQPQTALAALKPHSRFLLDQEPITWNDEVFVWWHPDDGYMVEALNLSRYGNIFGKTA